VRPAPAVRGIVPALVLAVCATAYGSDGEAAAGADLNFAQVENVKAAEVSAGSWLFEVTVRHRDEGWNHYANSWRVIDPGSGAVLGERILAHPHENEQPFTRSLGGITIPPELTRVLVQARCNIHGFGGREILVDLSRPQGEGYQVRRRGR
jgi:hypothetical protein